jgi:hypothetical protein
VFDTAIITRFHYPQDSKQFDWRFGFYRDYVLPTVLDQEDQDFDIAIWCEPWHEDQFRALSDKIRTFHATYTPGDNAPNYRRLFADFTEWENVSGLPKYKIQVGLDSDDIIGPEYVKTIHDLCVGHESALVSFQPVLLEASTGRIAKMQEYTPQSTSAFFALYSPDSANHRFAYCDSHLRLWKIVSKVFLIQPCHCCAVAHGRNDSTLWNNNTHLIAPNELAWVKKTRLFIDALGKKL